ncbi:dihydrolipoamide acetyltransferase family protein [Gordonia terrae]
MTETTTFSLPDVGEGLTEAEIVTWRVKPGDTVAINDILVEVETAKSLVELPSPHAGTVSELHAAEGDTVEVGSTIVSFGTSGDTSAPLARSGNHEEDADPPTEAVNAGISVTARPADDASQGDADEKPQPVLVGYGPSKAQVRRRARTAGYRVPDPFAGSGLEVGRPSATPPVRARARQLGIDLGTVRPTGPYGNVTRQDLAASAKFDRVHEVSEVRTPVKGVRKATAAAMVSSAFTAPHVTEWVTVDVTESLELLGELREDRALADVRLTPLVLIARATLSALRAHPEMNSKFHSDNGTDEIVQYGDVNLGIAAATPRGLLVPNIKRANHKSFRELCDDLETLIGDARSGKTQPAAMTGGTFTITNIGVFGVDGGTPILNPGESGILCVGQIAEQPWVHRGEIAVRSVCTLSMSFDHRLVDGQLGSQVLSHIARVLANPALALVY